MDDIAHNINSKQEVNGEHTNYLEYFKKHPNKILNFIISNHVIDSTLAKEFNDVYTKYSFLTVIENRNVFEKDFFEKEKYGFCDMENYFTVTINNYREYETNYINYKNLKDDILKNFDVYSICDNQTVFNIHKSQFESFLNRYEKSSEIHWGTLCMNKCLYFSDTIISKYNHVLSWEVLQYSGNLNWTFDLIESKKESLNWMVVSSYEFLDWNIDSIEKYKDYLIFSLGEGWRKQSMSSTKNKKGQWFEIKPGQSPKPLFNFKLKGSISLCETIKWSIELIDKVYDYWDWEELSLNKGIKWDVNLIEKYISKVNFKALSSNPSVQWSIELIKKYNNHWDWAELSHNCGIDFNYVMLLQFEEQWHWKPKLNNWYWDEYKDEKIKKCLASNKNIKWTLEIVDKFYERIDFWRISLHGIIDEDVLIKYSNEFNRKEKCGFESHKWSDFRSSEDIYKNAWENLKVNRNTKFTKNMIDFFSNYNITITYSTGNLAHDGDIIEENISLLELFKNLNFQDLTIDLVLLNHNNWGRTFLNNEFINFHLLEESIRPILSKEFSIKLLHGLRTMSLNL
jgi:hypothetical protein